MDKENELQLNSNTDELCFIPIVRGNQNDSELYMLSQSYVFDAISYILDLDDSVYNMGLEYLLNNNLSFSILWKIFECLKNDFSIVIEHKYVDRVYRDSYYSYYSGKHFSYSRYCRRISIFEGIFEDDDFAVCSDSVLNSKFIGSIVIRPIPNRAIGRTLLNPLKFISIDEYFIRLTKYSMIIYGRNLEVYAFPYSMQDGETTSCAEITILNISDYYSCTYQEYYSILPSDINRIIGSFIYERHIPTTGLSYQLISRIFTEIGFYPRLYYSAKMPSNKFRHLLHYYIESGIPIGIGLKMNEEKMHSIVGIGHGSICKANLSKKVYAIYNNYGDGNNVLWISDIADVVEEYCIMDDNREPYSFYKVKEEKVNDRLEQKHILNIGNYQADYLMVPLYKRMYLEAADAYDICISILANSEEGIIKALDAVHLDDLDKLISNNFGSKDNPVVIRLFMASSRTMHKLRHEQLIKINDKVARIYDETYFPKFVWICELYSVKSYQEEMVLGEIIIDATSAADAKEDSFIILHYPGQICRRNPDGSYYNNGKDIFEKISDWKPFVPYNGNLNSRNMIERKLNYFSMESNTNAKNTT